MSEQSLSYSVFHVDSDFEIRLFVLTHFSEALVVSKT